MRPSVRIGIAIATAILGLQACTDEGSSPASSQLEVDFSDWEGLDEDARSYLWEAEGLAFQIEHKVLPVWLESWQQGEVSGLASYLGTDASVDHPAGPWQELESLRHVTESSYGGSAVPVGLDDLLGLPALLLGGATEGAEMKLLLESLRQPGERGAAAGWESSIRMVVRNGAVEAEATLHCEIGPIGREVAETDGWLQSVSVREIRRRVGNDGGPLFEDVTELTGLPIEELHDNWTDKTRHLGGTGGVYVEDYDLDGHLDLLLTDASAGLRLFRGMGGFRFEDRTAESGLADLFAGELPGKAAWVDLDRDGDPDLVIAHRLFENAGDEGFLERSFGSGLALGNYSSISVADFDNDGQTDLFVSYSRDPNRADPTAANPAWIDGGWGVPNELWRNLGDWRFEEVAKDWGCAGEGGSTFTVTCLDIEADGDTDIFEINEFGRNHLYRNEGAGRFTDLGDPDPIFGGMSMGVDSGDVDNDGFPEVLVANMHSKAGTRAIGNLLPEWYPPGVLTKLQESTLGSQLYNNAGGVLSVAPPGTLDRRLGWGYGNRFLDIDGDGFLDLYATAGFASVARGKPDG